MLRVKRITFSLFLVLMLGSRLSIQAQRFLRTPIEGNEGVDFTIVNYVDWTLSGFQDAYCGSKSYDGHEGTDFTLRSFRQMDSGVYVLAADSGVVTFMLDSLFDRETIPLPSKGLGNSIAIKHPNGYFSYYGHLKKNSSMVNVGDTVYAGQRIGQVGSSGNSSDPHLHFELWFDSLFVVDPFKGLCGNDSTLWLNPISYDTSFKVWESGLYLKNIGINNLRMRDSSSICCPYQLKNKGDTLTYWSHLYGLRKGDTLTINWIDSSGIIQFAYDFPIKRDWWYFYFWTHINSQNLSFGSWKTLLLKNKKAVDSISFEVQSHLITSVPTIKHKKALCKPFAKYTSEELMTLEQQNRINIYQLNGKKVYSAAKLLSTENAFHKSSIYILRLQNNGKECVYKIIR